MANKLPLVVVVWNDAWVRAETPVDLEDVPASHKPEPVTTVGWLLYENEIGVQLANEYYENTYRGRTFIPRGMLISLTRYNLTKPRSKSRKRMAIRVEGERLGEVSDPNS